MIYSHQDFLCMNMYVVRCNGFEKSDQIIGFAPEPIEAGWRMYASVNQDIYGSDKGLCPLRCQVIIWTIVELHMNNVFVL